MIEDEKTLHSGAVDQKLPFDSRPLDYWLPARYRCGATDDDARADVQRLHNGVADWTGSVVDADVATVWTGGIEH